MILHVALVAASVLTRPAPVPKWVQELHKFYDKPAKIELALASSAAAFDMGQTCHNLATGGREYALTQSCSKNVGITTGILGAQELLALGLHKTGHHRLERLARLWSTPNNLEGAVRSKLHGAW